jgi:hypothetical protein
VGPFDFVDGERLTDLVVAGSTHAPDAGARGLYLNLGHGSLLSLFGSLI